jgi:hypothetical protein
VQRQLPRWRASQAENKKLQMQCTNLLLSAYHYMHARTLPASQKGNPSYATVRESNMPRMENI